MLGVKMNYQIQMKIDSHLNMYPGRNDLEGFSLSCEQHNLFFFHFRLQVLVLEMQLSLVC
jgi:hypothetical protein